MRDCWIKYRLVAVYEYLYATREHVVRDFLYRKKCGKFRLKIMNSYQTIEYIQKHNCSIARFGDGEFDMISRNRDLNFQKNSAELAEKLEEVLKNTNPRLLICVPRVLNTIHGCNYHAAFYWNRWAFEENKHHKNVELIWKYAGKNYRFGDAQVTRPYIDWETSKRAKKIFKMLKKLWEQREILIIEGEQTRLGVGNDLFDNCKNIKRILAPAENAFDYYEEIKETILKYYQKELVLVALGPTATVLASELSNIGIQVLDIGHVDVEYEWYLANVREKTDINGKYINEVVGGQKFSECLDKNYHKQVIAWIGCS